MGSETSATSEQETLDSGVDDTAERSLNLREQINSLYRSNQMLEQTAGFWAKALYEWTAKTWPLIFCILLPGLGLSWANTISQGYVEVSLFWGSITLSVTAVGWCMSEGKSGHEPNQT